jgi:hypothetical protein
MTSPDLWLSAFALVAAATLAVLAFLFERKDE